MFLDNYLTNSCNLRCSYCYFKEKNHKRCNIELIERTLNHFLSAKYKDSTLYYTFIGGEPMIEFELIKDAVEIGKKLAKKNNKKIFFNLVTNGVLLDDPKIDFLRKNNFYVVLSFDGKQKTQDHQRMFPRGNSCFNIVEDVLIKLNKVIPNLTVRMTVTPFSSKYLFDNVKYLFSKKIDRLGFIPTYEKNWDSGDFYLFKKNIGKILEMWKENTKNRPDFHIMPFINYIKNWNGNSFPFHAYMHSCQLKKQERGYSISVKGDIYPCHRFVSMNQSIFKFGNILNKGVEEDIEKKFYDKTTIKIRHKLFDYGCPALNYENNKNFKKLLTNYHEFENIYSGFISEIYSNKKYKRFLIHLDSFSI